MVRDVLVGLLMVVILKIFLPWWIIILIMGPVIVLAGYGWITRVTGIDPLWTKRIITIAIVIFLISLGGNLIGQKWPWLGKALESRSLYSSFWVTDQTDPKYPESLAMTVYQTELMQIEGEEKKYQEILRSFQEKMATGNELNNSEQSQIKEAKKKLLELDKKLAEIRLSRPNGKSWFKSVRTKTLLPKIFWFGTILLVVGLTLKLATKRKYGGLLIWLGGLVLFLSLALALFGSEIQAHTPEIKKWIQSSTIREKDSRPAGIYKLPADGRVISTTIDGRELDLKTGDRFQLTQLGQAGRYVFVNHDIPSHEIHERSITMRTVSDGKIELMSTETDKSMTIQAKVFR